MHCSACACQPECALSGARSYGRTRCAEANILPNPVLLFEIPCSDDVRDTWDNVWSYTTIPSVREILVVHSTRRFAELLRRDADGNWPAEPEEIDADGTLRLDSIAFACPLPAVYAQTHLA